MSGVQHLYTVDWRSGNFERIVQDHLHRLADSYQSPRCLCGLTRLIIALD